MNPVSMKSSLNEQREILTAAFEEWIRTPKYRTLRSVELNGDVLWLESQGHFWVGATTTWETPEHTRPITMVTKDGILKEGLMHYEEEIKQKRAFFRYFPELAEADASTPDLDLPTAMHGFRHAENLEEVYSYYEDEPEEG